jgi:hypothetical protein
MPNNNPFDSAENFNDAVVSEMKNKSLTVLSTHVRDLVLRSIQAVQKVYVDDQDSGEEMVAVVSEFLVNVGNAVSSGDIKIEFEKDNMGRLTTNFTMEINSEAREEIVPQALVARSGVNQARKALRNIIS